MLIRVASGGLDRAQVPLRSLQNRGDLPGFAVGRQVGGLHNHLDEALLRILETFRLNSPVRRAMFVVVQLVREYQTV
jgi:hypothetical protein